MNSDRQFLQETVPKTMKEKLFTIQLVLHQLFGCAKTQHGDHISMSKLYVRSYTFIAYRLVPSNGKTKELSAHSCKEINEALSNDCLQSGIYWVQNQQVHMYDGINTNYIAS